MIAVCLVAALAGCATPGTRGPQSEGGSFAQALRDCRVRQPGSLDAKLALPAERPVIRRCLAELGWNPDGSPTLDAILREPAGREAPTGTDPVLQGADGGAGP